MEPWRGKTHEAAACDRLGLTEQDVPGQLLKVPVHVAPLSHACDDTHGAQSQVAIWSPWLRIPTKEARFRVAHTADFRFRGSSEMSSAT